MVCPFTGLSPLIDRSLLTLWNSIFSNFYNYFQVIRVLFQKSVSVPLTVSVDLRLWSLLSYLSCTGWETEWDLAAFFCMFPQHSKVRCVGLFLHLSILLHSSTPLHFIPCDFLYQCHTVLLLWLCSITLSQFLWYCQHYSFYSGLLAYGGYFVLLDEF